MLIGDGVSPGNEGRGYVLRRLMRRAIRSMRLLGCEDPVLPELLPISRDKMGETYEGLHRDWERISTVAFAEEDAFRQTLRAGTTIFDTATAEVKNAGGTELSGERAFALHDTYGFPIDLTLEMAAEQGLDVDEVGFRRLMQEQRDRAKADARAKKGAHRDASAYRAVADAMGAPVDFTGYSEVVTRRHRARPGDRGRRGRQRPRGRRGRAGPRPHAVLRRGRRPARRPGHRRAVQRRAAAGRGRAVADHRADRPPGDRAQRRGDARPRGALAGRPRAPDVDLARAHGDPHGAQGVPRGAGGDRDPGGLGERARAGSGSTSPRPGRCRSRSWPTSRRRSTT